MSKSYAAASTISSTCEFKASCDTGYNVHVKASNLVKIKNALMDNCGVKVNDICQKESLPGEPFETRIIDKRKPIPDSYIFVNESKWQELCNVKTLITDDNILQVDSKSIYAFAQSSCPMEPTTNSSFKIQLLKFDYFKYMAIGFTRKGHPADKIPGLYEESIGCDSAGDLIVDKKSKKVGNEWKAGDVIECGVKFPCNFTGSDERDVRHHQVKVYFRRNGQMIAETKVKMQNSGYFPTIYMFEGVTGSWWNDGKMCMLGTDTKVRYFNRNGLLVADVSKLVERER